MGNSESGPHVAETIRKNDEKLYLEGNLYERAQQRYGKNYPLRVSEEDVRQPNTQSDRESFHDLSPPSRSPFNNKTKSPSFTFHTIPVHPVGSPISGTQVKSRQFVNLPPYSYQSKATPSYERYQETFLRNESDLEDTEATKLLKKIGHIDTEVIEATAAVYHYLETKSMEDDMTVTGRANAVLRIIKKNLQNGNTEPAYKFLETAKAVSEIMEEEQEADEESSPSVLQQLKDYDDNRSISNQSAAIFRLLDDAGSDRGGAIFKILEEGDFKGQRNRRILSNDGADTINVECEGDCLPRNWLLALSPKSKSAQTVKSINHQKVLQNRVKETYLAEVPEAASTAEETEVLSHASGQAGSPRKLDLTDLPHLYTVNADMDLEFVEYFDTAYDKFMAQNLRFSTRYPELADNLRIYKLQKLLEHNQKLESTLKSKLEDMQKQKLEMEETMHGLLKGAARKKAARQTFLQSELNNLSWSTKRIQAQLRWKFLEYSEDRAKRQFKLRQQYQAIPRAHNRRDLLPLIPKGPEGQDLRDTIQAAVIGEGSKPYMLSSRQEGRLKQLQLENSTLSSEIASLREKLNTLQTEAKRYAWVESILVRLDEGTMYKLKNKFQQKEGLTTSI